MSRNYHRKLSAIIYHHAKNMGIKGRDIEREGDIRERERER